MLIDVVQHVEKRRTAVVDVDGYRRLTRLHLRHRLPKQLQLPNGIEDVLRYRHSVAHTHVRRLRQGGQQRLLRHRREQQHFVRVRPEGERRLKPVQQRRKRLWLLRGQQHHGQHPFRYGQSALRKKRFEWRRAAQRRQKRRVAPHTNVVDAARQALQCSLRRIGQNRFQAVVECRQPQRCLHITEIGIPAQDDEHRLQARFPGQANQVNARHLRHPNVHNRGVEAFRAQLVQRSGRFRHQHGRIKAPVRPREGVRGGIQRHRLVINNQNAVHPRPPSSRTASSGVRPETYESNPI